MIEEGTFEGSSCDERSGSSTSRTFKVDAHSPILPSSVDKDFASRDKD